MLSTLSRVRDAAPHPTIAHGKYLISPLTKLLENGWHACSVSIRSGSGSATTDRVVRFTRLFDCRLAAAEYARQEGMHWIGAGASGGRPA